MCKRSTCLVLLAIMMSTSACATILGPAVGGVMGGPSLTVKLCRSEANVGIKIVGAPATMVGGVTVKDVKEINTTSVVTILKNLEWIVDDLLWNG